MVEKLNDIINVGDSLAEFAIENSEEERFNYYKKRYGEAKNLCEKDIALRGTNNGRLLFDIITYIGLLEQYRKV